MNVNARVVRDKSLVSVLLPNYLRARFNLYCNRKKHEPHDAPIQFLRYKKDFLFTNTATILSLNILPRMILILEPIVTSGARSKTGTRREEVM